MFFNIPRKPVARAVYSYENVVSDADDASRRQLQSSFLTPTPLPLPFGHWQTSVHKPGVAADHIVEVVSDGDYATKRKDIISRWKVGWKTPAVLVGMYLLALISAFGHLIFCLKLNGTHVQGYFIPQGYVTTISNLIATTWSICLSVCLSGVFTQGFWNVLRNRPTSIATIENLYGLLGNIFLFRPRLMVSMPMLYAIAILLWSLSILKTLPPGALVVQSMPLSNTTEVIIPSFSSAMIGNGTLYDLRLYMPGEVTIYILQNDLRVLVGDATDQGALKRVMQRYFTSGELLTYVSPCGSNCSYMRRIEGPYLDCNTTLTNITMSPIRIWQSLQFRQLEYDFYHSDYNITSMSIQRFRPINVPVIRNGNEYKAIENQTLLEVWDLRCKHATALYTVNTSYTNGLQNISYNTYRLGHLDYLDNCAENFTKGTVTIPGISCGNFGNQSNSTSDGNIVFDGKERKALAGLKTYTLMTYMLEYLKGSVSQYCMISEKPAEGINSLDCSIGSANFTKSPLIDSFFYYFTSNDWGTLMGSKGGGLANGLPEFQVAPDVLNAALFNLTMTFMHSKFNFARRVVTAEMNWQLLTFVFSQKLNLILPYFIPLILTIPALVYSMILLYRSHHVAAMGDSFIQILMTTTGTRTITDLAAGGCLGGPDNVPKELEELEIRYGDITDSAGETETETSLRRAGFGVEGEVTPLRRRAVYGSSIYQ